MMKKMLMLMAFAFLAVLVVAAYCQDESADERDIEQSESQMSQGLGSEISSEQSQAQGELGEVDESMNTDGYSSY